MSCADGKRAELKLEHGLAREFCRTRTATFHSAAQ
jgi:hypothetical protein